MTDHLLMVLEDERAHAAQSPAEIAAQVRAQARFAAELRDAGTLRDGCRLRPSVEAKRVARVAGELRVTDGPFVDDGLALAACYLVDADLDAAARLAAGYPALAGDVVDVRPVMKGVGSPDKEATPGKIVACAVLGNAATEAAWVDVMDRIDAATRAELPPGARLGGVRLMPPTTGKRVATRGDRRAILDGPFLEAREVIGGVTYLRVMALDEAIAWAAASRFLDHGALEVRELWRS